MNTTHLALSEPGGAPVTADETSPLGRRRTRGFFIRQGDRERARSELTDGVQEVARAVEPYEGTKVEETGKTFQSEHKHERNQEPKEELSGAEK